MSHVGTVDRFSTPEKLVAYIGLDCRVFEGGTSVKGKGYISKRGNGLLRRTLWNAAFIARQRNPELKAYFEKKISEGKHYSVELCAVERKLIHLAAQPRPLAWVVRGGCHYIAKRYTSGAPNLFSTTSTLHPR